MVIAMIKNASIRPTLGVIGGMGTGATARFYEMLHSLQNVKKEQEYIDIIVYSKPSIPDRTAYILGQSTDSPLSPLIHAAKTLETAGVDSLAIPCVTSHYFYKDLQSAVRIPIINMLDETAAYISENGYQKIGLLATDGTIKGRFFHDTMEKQGIDIFTPPEKTQEELMNIIYDIKRGQSIKAEALDGIVAQLQQKGAQTTLLGCTELSLIKKISSDHIDALEILAHASLKKCTGP